MPLTAPLITTASQRYPHRIALREADSGVCVTFAQLTRVVDHCAVALRQCGLGPGDRLALFARNSIHWVAIEIAAAKLGVTLVPITIYQSAHELAWFLRDSSAAAVAVDVGLEQQAASALDELGSALPLIGIPAERGSGGSMSVVLASTSDMVAEPAPHVSCAVVDPASTHRLVYSSGTSGRPKRVHCSHELQVATIMTSLANQTRGLQSGDQLLVTTPLTHFANTFLWAFLCHGHTSVLTRRFDGRRTLDVIRRHRVTHVTTAPTLIADLVGVVEADQSITDGDWPLKAMWYAGSPMPATLAARASSVFGEILNQQYGLTEAIGIFPATGITELTAEWHARKPGSCGRPVLGAVIRVVDGEGRPLQPGEVGEVAILKGTTWRGENDSRPRTAPEWLYTGDIGTFDEDGFLYLKGRRSDMIISGGLNIFPGEVEDALRAHPAVAECAVAGMPHERWIETPQALVVCHPGTPVTEAELHAFCRDRLAHYKCPSRIVFASALPTNPTGKVIRSDVVDLLKKSPS